MSDLIFTEQAAGTTPSAGKRAVFVKPDGKLYIKDSAGVETAFPASSEKDATGGYAGLTLFKLNLRNAANTITSWFTTAATVARTWTLPDKDGTVAMTSDITGTNSGTNTGDQSLTSLGIPNVNNTSDANKPVSTAQAASIALRYGKNNILGTVSQSAGVPTGAVIERGSNANGEYVRFADGTQICQSIGYTTVAGVNTARPTPAAFAGIALCYVDIVPTGSWDFNVHTYFDGTFQLNAGAAGNTARFTAIGRWF